MNAYDTLFAIDCVASGIAVVSIGGIVRAHFVTRKLRHERDEAVAALRNEETEHAHTRKLADDALANIEMLQAEVANAKASAGRWAGMYLKATFELGKIRVAEEEQREARRARMRRIGIIGNKSPARRKASVPA